MPAIEARPHRATTHDGWSLDLRVTRAPGRLDPDTHPLLMLPGYGMNNFILGFHPRGTSMETALAHAGFEVWSVNLRGQGRSRPLVGGAPPPSIAAFVGTDVPAAIDLVAQNTDTRSDRVVLVGCSLGGTIAYAHLALSRRPRVAALVSVGAPLRWDELHPAVKVIFSSPWLASRIHLKQTRRLAGLALPIAAKFPRVLGLYLNAKHVDLEHAPEMVATVDDLHPRVNRDIARWVRHGDLLVHGVNVTEALRAVDVPLLIVLANKDSVVPPGAARSAERFWGGRNVSVLSVGDDERWFSHADLFVSNHAPELVFHPMASWLEHHARL